jgi:hypothetical protein
VATAAQSHVVGRVGPPSIAQDSDAPWHTPEGVGQIRPGQVLDASTVVEGGHLETAPLPSALGAGPYGGDTPADDKPNTIKATTPGEDEPGVNELPPNTPLPGDAKSSSSLTPTGVPTGKAAADSGADSTTTSGDDKGAASPLSGSSGTSEAGKTTTAPGSSGSPTLPTEGSASSPHPGSDGDSETADSGTEGSDTGPAESGGTSEPSGSAGSSTSKPSTSG